MSVWVYSVMHNEAALLPYFLRHYGGFAARVVIFDDHSDDGTAERAAALGADVRPYPGDGLDDQALVDFAAGAYPEARGRADWVLWVDADEFIYHPQLPAVLGWYRDAGVTLPRVAGYQMVSETFPQGCGQIYEQVREGVPDAFYDKPVVFDPRLDLRWIPGKHALAAGAGKQSATAELKLLHYRWLGAEYVAARNHRNHRRMTVENLARHYGYQVYAENQAAHGWDAQAARFAEKQVVV